MIRITREVHNGKKVTLEVTHEVLQITFEVQLRYNFQYGYKVTIPSWCSYELEHGNEILECYVKISQIQPEYTDMKTMRRRIVEETEKFFRQKVAHKYQQAAEKRNGSALMNSQN